MRKLKLVNQYSIPFAGLKDGKHEFKFGFGKKFFKKHEIPETFGGEIEVLALLVKKENILRLETQMSGLLNLKCDRCLETFCYPIQYTGNLIIKFGENVDESTDEIWVLNLGDHELHLEQYFFECISLSLPIQKIHPKSADGISGCNPEMLKILNTHNNSASAENKKKDPRWDKLKDLLE